MRFKLLLVCAFLLLLPKPGSGQSTLRSGTYRFEDLPSQKQDNATFRPILDGLTRSGMRVDVHEVFLLPGSAPHHAHRHQQEELFLISEGEVEVTINGKATKLGPGSAAYAASEDEHQIQNVGTRPAQYFEVILDAKGPTQHPEPSH
jgi:(S)-ureidoglycine aminohydrolase